MRFRDIDHRQQSIIYQDASVLVWFSLEFNPREAGHGLQMTYALFEWTGKQWLTWK